MSTRPELKARLEAVLAYAPKTGDFAAVMERCIRYLEAKVWPPNSGEHAGILQNPDTVSLKARFDKVVTLAPEDGALTSAVEKVVQYLEANPHQNQGAYVLAPSFVDIKANLAALLANGRGRTEFVEPMAKVKPFLAALRALRTEMAGAGYSLSQFVDVLAAEGVSTDGLHQAVSYQGGK